MMLDDTKIAVEKLLKECEKQSRHWRKCLLVQLEGVGRFDEPAARAAHEEWLSAVECVQEALSDTVTPTGLLRETG